MCQCPRRANRPANLGPIERRAGYCAAVYLSWSTGPRGRVCHPYAASSRSFQGRNWSRSEDGTGRARLGAGRMPGPGENLAQGNLNSMPQIMGLAKSRANLTGPASSAG